MPVLKQYATQPGYYINTNISGGEPITLQTDDAAVKIYRELGYDPDVGGTGKVSVPNELTWTFYEVGLHWTHSSGSPDLGDSPDEVFDSDGPKLTSDDVEKIVALIEDYDGAEGHKINQLYSLLTENEVDLPSEPQQPRDLNRMDDAELELWNVPDILYNEIAQHVERKLSESLNSGAVTEWKVEASIEEWEPDEDPGTAVISVWVEHLATPDQKYFHIINLCEEHGLEQIATVSNERSWRTRVSIESQRGILIESVVEASNEFDIAIGAPDDNMTVVFTHDPSIFETHGETPS